MDLDELFPDKPDDPLTLLTQQDLDPLSVEELRGAHRILEAEIERVKAKLKARLTSGQALTSYSRNEGSHIPWNAEADPSWEPGSPAVFSNVSGRCLMKAGGSPTLGVSGP